MASPPVRMAVSKSDPAVVYRVTRTSCDCPDFQYQPKRKRGYRCKHMEEEFPFMCMQCGQAPAMPRRTLCLRCNKAAHDWDAPPPPGMAERLLAGALDYVARLMFAPSAYCVRCWERYEWTEQAPLYCPKCLAERARAQG